MKCKTARMKCNFQCTKCKKERICVKEKKLNFNKVIGNEEGDFSWKQYPKINH